MTLLAQQSDPNESSTTVITVVEEDATTEETTDNETEKKEEEDESFWEVELGFIVGVGRSVIGSLNQSEEGYLIHGPWFAGGYYNGDFFVESDPGNGKPLTIGYTAYESEQYQVNVIATPLFLGYEEKSQQRGDMLTGIDDRNPSFDAGIELLASYDFGQFGIRAVNDIADTHSGFALDVMYGYPVYLEKMVIWPSVGMTFLSSKVTDYYYGVRPHEARIDRPVYQLGSSFTTKFNLYFERELTERSSMIGFSQIFFLTDEVVDSPLVDHKVGFTMGLGMIWTF